jgi:murein DD-endopeptidase MepM/ murein hydrolase activator NlpD
MVSMGNKTVYSTIEGVVEYAGWGGDGFGIRVYVRNSPYLVIYPHLSRVLVAAGQRVEWGQPVGIEGSTGYSTGSHLHYEIHINGTWIDSTPFLYR